MNVRVDRQLVARCIICGLADPDLTGVVNDVEIVAAVDHAGRQAGDLSLVLR